MSTTSTTTTLLPSTTPSPVFAGESVFSNPTGIPFSIFVILAGFLFISTLIAIIVLKVQHHKHLTRINAVRGFHQHEMKEGTDIIHELDISKERSTSLGLGGDLSAGRRSSEQSGPPSPGLRGNGVSGGLGHMANSWNAHKGSTNVSKTGGSVQAKHHHRMIYDFHHTPKQPDLAPSLLAGAAGGVKIPPLNLMGGGSGNNFSPASSANFSPNRAVGMSMRRK